MEETCPICFKAFPVKFLERHVNSCLDTVDNLPSPEDRRLQGTVESIEESPVSKNVEKFDAFTALGLKVDSRKSGEKGNKKEGAKLTSILIAERKLKRKQQELESAIKRKALEERTYKSPIKESVKQESETSVQSSNSPSSAPHSQLKKEKMVLEPVLNVCSQAAVLIPQIQSSPVASSQSKSEALRRSQEIQQFKREAELPLAQRLRPKTLDDFYGQEKLVGPDGILTNIMNAEQMPSFILWGVPGVGKTSLARIIATTSHHKFVELSGSESNAKKLKEAFANAVNEKNLTGKKTVLFLDEIHRFNKAVQDLLLPVIEKGVVTVIGATTENPSFTLNNALLSRMHTFVMEPLSQDALVKILNKGLLLVNKTRKFLHRLHLIAMNKEAIDYIAKLSTGDSRVALNILESINAYLSGLKYTAFSETESAKETIQIPEKTGIIKVNLENLKPLLSTRNFHQMYDKVGENHYDTISAFHKSVRGSDADAAIFYLVKMLSGGEDPLFIARRMIVIASEDVGLRDSSCLPFAIAAMEAIQFVGMPEGEIILAHCAVKLARAPKSTKSYRALRTAQSLLKENPDITKLPIPLHLRNAPTKLMKELGYGDTYKYNPNFKHGLIKQEFMPEEVKGLKLVEDTHLGALKDLAVESAEYDKADEEVQDYNNFKKFCRKQLKEERLKRERKTFQTTKHLLAHSANFNEAERMTSYDENLPKDDQPAYFDGSERDNYSDDPDCTHNFECSYDEFLDESQHGPDEADYPINFD